ncbi:thiol:disulfide interchange protein [Bacteroidia bacterium]|nr:thiol:disulfide interchange protein [Bacteroidia bacterium]GHT78714.1 thiol:disulfide interchange protein [Bacteroidia bacterium]
MKKVFLISAAVIVTFGCNRYNLSVKGTVEGDAAGKVYLHKFDNKMYRLLDSTEVVDGAFAIKANVELPEIYALSYGTKSPYLIFMDGNPVTVQLNADPQKTVVSGSLLQDEYEQIKSTLDGLNIKEYITRHPTSLVSAYVLYRFFSYRLSVEELRHNVSLLDASLQNTPYVNTVNELIKVYESVAIGKTAPDFTENDATGKPVKLSDFYGKSYILLDFWASWCPPCRAENPNIVALYEQYKDKGFNILGVSLDKAKDRWLKGIADDHLTWTHVSDLQYWNSAAAKLYGVRAIPSNFLLDKNGVIIGKNLRGDDLKNKLAELYQ